MTQLLASKAPLPSVMLSFAFSYLVIAAATAGSACKDGKCASETKQDVDADGVSMLQLSKPVANGQAHSKTTQLLQDAKITTVFSQNFDNEATTSQSSVFGSRHKSDLAVVHEGESGKALRISYTPTSRGSTRLTGEIFKMPLGAMSANYSYRVKFDDDFDFVRGGKLGVGFFGGKGTTGCKPIDPKGWSARVMWRSDGRRCCDRWRHEFGHCEDDKPCAGRLEQYLYHQDRADRCGDRQQALKKDGSPLMLERGRWYTIEQAVLVNDPPDASNGEASLYVDGVLVAQRKSIRWRGVDSKDNTHIKSLGLSTFYGGASSTWAPTKTTHAIYDDFRVTMSVEYCKSGIRKSKVCCHKSCKTCGGSGCASRLGGASMCCTGTITRSKKTCESSDSVGCVIK